MKGSTRLWKSARRYGKKSNGGLGAMSGALPLVQEGMA